MTPNKRYLILVALCFSVTASATDFYVSPSGSDVANGLYAMAATKGGNGPFQTLARAQQAIRTLKASGKFTQPVKVHVAPGNYPLSKPLQFNVIDSGLPGREITWQGLSGATTVISGGKVLTNCHTTSGLWSCPVAGLGLDGIKYSTSSGRLQGNLPGFNLFVNQERLTLARWPNTDWAHIKLPTDSSRSFSSFEALPAVQGDLAHAVVHIFAGNDWFDEYLPVASVAQSLNQITLGMDTKWTLASGYRYYLLNLLSQLDAPGEWFYDQPNARILFIPPTGVSPQNVVVSAVPNLLTLVGVSYVTFQNISFQDATDVAVSIVNCSNLLMNNLEVTNVDTIGIKAAASRNISVSNSYIHDTGQGGLIIDGGNRITLQSSNNVVYNNHFESFGSIILTSSPGISATGVGVQISNNLIEQGAGGGVIINGNQHVFEKNEVRNVCLQSADCGALYSGRDWSYRGNIISYNSFHDIYGYGLQSVNVSQNSVKYGSPTLSAAVYLDDAVSSFNIIGNIFNNAGTIAIHLGGGRDNVIENNVFNTNNSYAIYVDDRWPNFDWSALYQALAKMPFQDAKWAAKYPALAAIMKNPTWPEGNTIQSNVIIANNTTPALLYILPVESTSFANNLYWAASGKVVVSYTILDNPSQIGTGSWQSWMQQGLEKNSFNIDPCATISGNQVSFCAGSPINKIGFQALPTDIGLIN